MLAKLTHLELVVMTWFNWGSILVWVSLVNIINDEGSKENVIIQQQSRRCCLSNNWTDPLFKQPPLQIATFPSQGERANLAPAIRLEADLRSVWLFFFKRTRSCSDIQVSSIVERKWFIHEGALAYTGQTSGIFSNAQLLFKTTNCSSRSLGAGVATADAEALLGGSDTSFFLKIFFSKKTQLVALTVQVLQSQQSLNGREKKNGQTWIDLLSASTFPSLIGRGNKDAALS